MSETQTRTSGDISRRQENHGPFEGTGASQDAGGGLR